MKITGETSDGYHTFNELYEHRCILFMKLCKHLFLYTDKKVWKSKLHSDGSSFEGWFIAGIGVEQGDQITYHLPLKYWDAFKATEHNHAPLFDGHTSDDVLERLMKL